MSSPVCLFENLFGCQCDKRFIMETKIYSKIGFLRNHPREEAETFHICLVNLSFLVIVHGLSI